MEALFIGHSYIDVTIVAPAIPQGDDKTVADDYAVSFGGNAVTAAFAYAKLGGKPDLLATQADDWLGRMFADMALSYRVSLHARKVARSSLSLVIPRADQRAILRMRDDQWLHPFPALNINGARVVHVDGHQHDAALHYAGEARSRGVLTSLDGGAVRQGTNALLGLIDVAVVAERFCEQLELSADATLNYLRERGVKVGGVTQGARGMLWFEGAGAHQRLDALPVPHDLVVDTNGAGDVFHGAYVWSYVQRPAAPWAEHFRFARAASAYAIQHLGNEAKLPTAPQVLETAARFGAPLHGIMTR
ncbi:MAG TPA: ribokinase [Alphaproteobacteria bacterium]|nr:ribokinase [Alphaproteobacteria bacterium]HAJ48682.1 ribokinase [Alphaproteobacteria bacterium]